MKKQQYFAPDGSLIEMEFFNCRNVVALVNDPSPSEIAAMTASIRSGWSEKERYNRSRFLGVRGQSLLPQTIDTDGVEQEARTALARRLAAQRRGATSLIAKFRQFAADEGWTERAEA